MSWRDQAACLTREYPSHWWDDEDGETTRTRALQVCWGECPVREQCLTHALEEREPTGIWGGRTANQRHRHMAGTAGSRRTPRPAETGDLVACGCGRRVRPSVLEGHGGKCGTCRMNARRRAAFEDRVCSYVELHTRGLTQPEIAAQLGVHPATIHTYARAARDRGVVPVPSRTRARLGRVARAQQLATQGLTVAQIASELGVAPKTVRRYLTTATT